MTTRKKILMGFIVIFLLGLSLGICGLVSVNTLTSLSNEQYSLQNASAGVSTVLNAHYTWRQGLTEAVLTGAEFTGSLEPDKCALGQWRNSDEAKSIVDPETLAMLERIGEPHAYIHNEARGVKDMIDAGNLEGAKSKLVQDMLPRTADVISILTDMESRYDTLQAEKGAEIISMGKTVTLIIIILIAVAVVFSILAAWMITLSIMNPIRNIAQTAEAISTGDLDVQIDYSVKDEIGQLADAFRNLLIETKKQVAVAESLADGDLTVTVKQRSEKDAMNIALHKMVDNLNMMFGEINTAAGQVSSGSEQVSHGAQELAAGSTQQAASIEELSASLSDLQEKTNRNAVNSSNAREANDKTAKGLEDSIQSMGRMLGAMREIDESSSNITKVIKVIDDIAFQTNILALNAAVEAARAGQHGKGFAVVADEVRNLAAKSAEAAKETSSLIDGSSSRVKEGNEIVAQTNANLESAVENARESTRLIEQVALASMEQAKSITEINQGMDQISGVVQANSATAEESAAASEEMSAQAVVLNEIVGKFKLKKAGAQNKEASDLKTDSGQYVQNLGRTDTSGFAISGDKY